MDSVGNKSEASSLNDDRKTSKQIKASKCKMKTKGSLKRKRGKSKKTGLKLNIQQMKYFPSHRINTHSN